MVKKMLPNAPRGAGYVSWGAKIRGRGRNIFLGKGSIINEGALIVCKSKTSSIHIGENVDIAWYAHLNTLKDGFIKIDDRSEIGPFCTLYGGSNGIKIGKNVRIGPHCMIVGTNHNFDDLTVPIYEQGISQKGIVIGDDVWIGGGAIILDGVTIGSHSVIATGAVVTKDVKENSVMAGVPAHLMRKRGHANRFTTFPS